MRERSKALEKHIQAEERASDKLQKALTRTKKQEDEGSKVNLPKKRDETDEIDVENAGMMEEVDVLDKTTFCSKALHHHHSPNPLNRCKGRPVCHRLPML